MVLGEDAGPLREDFNRARGFVRLLFVVKPTHLMHQLYELQDSKKFPYLDRDVFAKEVNQLLARLPPLDATE